MSLLARLLGMLGALLKVAASAKPTPGAKPIGTTPPATPFLNTLRPLISAPLTREDYVRCASRLDCDWQALAAVAEVESGRLGAFFEDRPVILFERHLFSRKTQRAFDHSHPHLSGPAGGYPPNQRERWAQLAEAFALDPEAALESTSWGRFQLLGQNFADLGLLRARSYVAKIARSERDGLEAFQAFIIANSLTAPLRAKDWATFARRYNGANYRANRYDERMAEAYARLKQTAQA